MELPIKTDLVVWIPLSDAQKALYKMIIDDRTVRVAVSKTNDKHKDYTQMLVLITILRHVCVHPLILSNSQKCKCGFSLTCTRLYAGDESESQEHHYNQRGG